MHTSCNPTQLASAYSKNKLVYTATCLLSNHSLQVLKAFWHVVQSEVGQLQEQLQAEVKRLQGQLQQARAEEEEAQEQRHAAKLQLSKV